MVLAQEEGVVLQQTGAGGRIEMVEVEVAILVRAVGTGGAAAAAGGAAVGVLNVKEGVDEMLGGQVQRDQRAEDEEGWPG